MNKHAKKHFIFKYSLKHKFYNLWFGTGTGFMLLYALMASAYHLSSAACCLKYFTMLPSFNVPSSWNFWVTFATCPIVRMGIMPSSITKDFNVGCVLTPPKFETLYLTKYTAEKGDPESRAQGL